MSGFLCLKPVNVHYFFTDLSIFEKQFIPNEIQKNTFASGSLNGDGDYGIAPEKIAEYAKDIQAVVNMGCQVAIVIGGGNIFWCSSCNRYGPCSR